MSSEERYVFSVEWYDSAASLIRTYNLIYYLGDNTIEMVPLFFLIFLLMFSIVWSQKQKKLPEALRVPFGVAEWSLSGFSDRDLRSTT